MRIPLAGAAGALLLALAGCGQGSDNEVRASIRDRSIESCIAGSRNAPEASRLDWPRLCRCVVDRSMAGRSTADLRNPDPSDPVRRAASQQCMMEQMGAAPGAPAGNEAANGAGPAG